MASFVLPFVLMVLGAFALMVLIHIPENYPRRISFGHALLFLICLFYVGCLTILGGAFVGFWLGTGQ